ncbi:MAG: SUMF1/EgtB/PvdO family nonheme iron enzyme [Acidobacteria bacterium]|nr:SUMF1/EgtB/PvdO family nonheme iron enzyme [Acidobacteriota bacterium]
MRLLAVLGLLCQIAASQQRDLSVVPIIVQKRVALVIGNAAYPQSPLKNPTNDAASMTLTLRQLGFEVIDGRDVTLRRFEELVDQFIARLNAGDLALFYYAGHGAQIQLENYLVPVDYHGASETDLRYTSYPANRIRERMEESGARLRVLILDACRNNPFRAKRDNGGGLAKMSGDAEGTLIAFATGDNNVADDNAAGKNGLFTKYLMQEMTTPGLSHDEVFRKVKADVYFASGKKQNPYTYENVVGRFYFTPASGAGQAAAGSTASAAEVDLVYWDSIKGSRNLKLFESYLARYPNGQFAEIARAKVEELNGVTRSGRLADSGAKIAELPDGKSWLNPKDGQRYWWIPPGQFSMGCSAGDPACYATEKPAHPMTMSQGYWMAETPVTVAAWKRFAQAAGATMPPPAAFNGRELNAGWANEQQPVVNVTWDNANAFCAWAGARLPTEAEYEFAARGKTAGARYGALDAIAWYADNSGKDRIDSAAILRAEAKSFGQRISANANGPKPVALKEPNAFRLYDMLGNVWEWTADRFADYGGAPTAGDFRVLRGGSWWSHPREVRASARLKLQPGQKNINYGFRCAR